MNVRSSLSIAPQGVGTVYVSLPLGTYESEREMLLGLAARRQGVFPVPPEVYLLNGQADLAARFLVDDFRGILGLGYPAEQPASAALVYNWVYSARYVIPPSDLRPTRNIEDQAGVAAPTTDVGFIPASRMHFIVHLRVLRSFYAADPIEAETRLVQHLESMFPTANVSIETGVGWPDLILNGSVDAIQFRELLNTLIRVNTLKAGNGVDEAQAVFTRTLTLFGHPWNGDVNSVPRVDGGFKALMFVRSLPGRLAGVQTVFRDKMPGTQVSIVDGKLDLVARLDSPDADFFSNQVALVEGREGCSAISKLETHLLFGDDQDSPLHEETPRTAAADLVIPGLCLRGCRCKDGFRDVQLSAGIPIGLQHAIRNLLYLMRTALKDSTNCCDIRPAILGCLNNLFSLLASLQKAMSRLKSVEGCMQKNYDVDELRLLDPRLAAVVALVTANLIRIERWVLLGERVLRQRTIGSFEEFLGQSDRAVFYRGGAQKMLFLADSLMNEFYRGAVPSLGRFAKAGINLECEVPLFASLYDAIDTIESETTTGLVRVPAQNVFMLASVIPDLWHEVGMYCFFNYFDDSRTDLRSVSRDQDQSLNVELADHFGDVVVLVYGFNCRFRQFMISILHRFFDSTPEHLGLLRETLLAAVVLRLMLVLDLLDRCIHGFRDRLLGRELIKVISRIVGEHMPQRRTEFKTAWWRANEAWRAPAYEKIAQTLYDLAPLDEIRRRYETVRDGMKAEEPSDVLPRFDPSDDLNEKMYQVHWAIERSHLSGSVHKAFGYMAAVGRSAVLEYHRRLANEDTPHRKTAFEDEAQLYWPDDPTSEEPAT